MHLGPYSGPMNTRTASSTSLVSDTIRLGFELDAYGFTGREAAIRQLVRTARSRGVDGAALGVLADIAAPDVARLRAFAAVSVSLASSTTSPGELVGAA